MITALVIGGVLAVSVVSLIVLSAMQDVTNDY